MTMTLEELQRETLVEKHLRLQQSKCRHEEIWSSTFSGPEGTFSNRICLDCGKVTTKGRDWMTQKDNI